MNREQVVLQMLSAKSEDEVSAAKTARDQWMAAHPDDDTVRSASEQLAFMEHTNAFLRDRVD